MATLEKIRKRQGILFTVIIVALLAFILGDFFNSSRSIFGPGNSVAKVDGHKIDYPQFQQKVEQMRLQMQNSGYEVPDVALLQQEVLNQMVYDELLKQEYKDLGIVVTDNELSQAMLGATALPGFVQQIQQAYGVATPDQLHDMSFNPGKYGIPADQASQLQAAWTQMEKSLENELLQAKLGNLFMGSLVANKLDAKDLFDQNSETSTINYAKVDYSTLSGDEYAPTEAEVLNKYNSMKSRFKLTEPVRRVQYIAVDIQPSSEDLTKAQQDVEAALELLNKEEGVEGLPGLFVTNTTTNKKAGFNPAVASALDSLAVGQARLVSFANNTYTLAKLLGKNESQLDSVKYEFGVINVTSPAQRDSLINALNSGASLEEVTAGQFQPSVAVSLIDPQAAPLKEIIKDRPVGKFFTPDTAATAQQVRIVRINGYSPAVTTYDVAEIAYQVDPSSTTVNTLRQNLANFIAENNTAAKFSEEAVKAGYTSFPAEVSSQSLALANIPESRNAVKWTNKAKKGQVSPVFGDEQTGRFIAVALTDIFDDYIPVTEQSVNTYIKELVTNDKKAHKLIEEYKGKGNSVATYATAMNTKADTTQVVFGQPLISGFTFGETELPAAVAVAEKGKLVGPIQGSTGVIVFEVLDNGTEGRAFDFNTDASRFNQMQGGPVLSRNLFGILLGKNIIENNLLNFYQDEAEQ